MFIDSSDNSGQPNEDFTILIYAAFSFFIANTTLKNNSFVTGSLLQFGSITFDIIIQNNTIMDNRVIIGTLFFGDHRPIEGNVIIRNNVFTNNRAQMGGVFFISKSIPAQINNNTLINNSASLYGNSCGSTGQEMIFIRPLPKNLTLKSGKTLPTFSVALLDLFGNIVKPVGFNDMFVPGIRIHSSSQSKQFTIQGSISKQSQSPMLQWENEALFEFAEFTGLPGDYILIIEPVINYDKSVYFLTSQFRVAECQDPYINYQLEGESFPRCVQGIQQCSVMIVIQ
jgi:hypothetical protein